MEKKFKRGLVLGKFMPPHNGHLYLINSAAEQCEKLFVIVGTQKIDPINGILRYNWLKMIYDYNENIEIIHCTDENPQKPEECESLDMFYNDYWVPSVYNRIKTLDVVFTSETYGEEFAQYLGIEHVLVDIERKTYPVSGTMVRDNPFKLWELIPNEVKSYYTKRIVIMGPESTGKTMLTKRLADEYGVHHIQEYGRTYTETIKPGKSLEINDFHSIAVEHNNHILDSQTTHPNKLVFIDTEAVTTKLFGELYIDGYKDERIDEIIRHQWFDLILLMNIDIPWVDDGCRDFPNDREKHFNMIKNELDRLGRKYVIINGDYDERFNSAKKLIDAMID